MDTRSLEKLSDVAWRLPRTGDMRVPALLHASAPLLGGMEDDVLRQLAGVTTLPGVCGAVHAMPDAHVGYGFPIGAVAAMDLAGVVSAGGVGFDIACGVRTLLTDLDEAEVRPRCDELAEALYRAVPSGMGGGGVMRLSDDDLDAMLAGGARWALDLGYGEAEDLPRAEDGGTLADAEPGAVSTLARKRQHDEMGTLGSGNHYLEVQAVERILDPLAAETFGLRAGQVLVAIHCGSRGLGHQVATDYVKEMNARAGSFGLSLPDKELACAPIGSELGRRYLGAMAAAHNCALANRQIISQLVRRAVRGLFGRQRALPLLADVCHNTCRLEEHKLGPARKQVMVHRKGATRVLPPNDSRLPPAFRAVGQPVAVGGSMGTASYILAGLASNPALCSACHGAGRAMSRGQAKRRWKGREVAGRLREMGIVVRAGSLAGLAEEAPGAYKDVDEVVEVTLRAGLARPVARLRPLVCIKG